MTWGRAHLASRDVAHVLYGATVGLALVIATQDHPPHPYTMFGEVLGVAITVGLADMYAESVSTEARTQRPLGRAQVKDLGKEALFVVFGAGFPAVFFLLAMTDVISMAHAFTLSKWTGLVLVCGYGFLAGRLAGKSTLRAVGHAVGIAAIGVGVILLKSLAH